MIRPLGPDLWEATQPELGRRVALRRLPPGTAFDATRWPDRAGVVGLYAVVDDPQGTYVATRFVHGARTYAQCGMVRASRRRRWLDEVASTLDGAPHGDLTAADILIDRSGRALVTGFGRPPSGDDGAALAALRPAARRGGRAVPLVVVVLTLGAGLTLVLRGDSRDPDPAPPVAAGATAYGSALAPGALETVDCEGARPGGSSPPCTILQTALPGRPLSPTKAGLVHAWAVRGARGRVRLQILTRSKHGYVAYNNSRSVTITDAGHVHVFRADRSFPKGARFALEVKPGGAVGIRSGVRGATSARYFGPLRSVPRGTPDPRGGRGQELLLRVDVVPLPPG